LKTICARRKELENHVPIVGGRRKGLFSSGSWTCSYEGS